VITGAQAVREYLRGGRIEEATKLLDQVTAAANTTYTETREGILALRTAGSAAEIPLDRLLHDYVAEWGDRTGIAVTVSIASGLSLPTTTELQLVRIAQEALANVRKHAKASKVDIKF
jgi:two-component system nitrate/nitrite sensor histidine kinase NarX